MKVLVNGQLIEYKKEGRGRTILLLHGWGDSLATFNDLTKYFVGRGFEVIRFDFPGFGGSAKPDDSWGVSEYAALTGELLKKLKVKNLYALVGHSFGGRVIIKGIASGFLDAKKVVLIGAAGVKPPKSAKKQAFKAVAKVGKAVTALPGLKNLREGLRESLYGAAGSTDYLRAGQMQQIFLNTINEDLLPEVAAMTQPTLLLWGENDSETPVRQAELIQAQLPYGTLVVVPEAGHFVFMDDPTAVTKELDGFL